MSNKSSLLFYNVLPIIAKQRSAAANVTDKRSSDHLRIFARRSVVVVLVSTNLESELNHLRVSILVFFKKVARKMFFSIVFVLATFSAFLLFTMSSAYQLPKASSKWMKSSTLLFAEEQKGQRFNTKIDLQNEKVVNTISLKAGEKAVLCRCWKSSKFPYCDGAHVAHNKETGDNLGPCIAVGTKDE